MLKNLTYQQVIKYLAWLAIAMFIFMMPYDWQSTNYVLLAFVVFTLLNKETYTQFKLRELPKFEKMFLIFCAMLVIMPTVSLLWSDDKKRGIELIVRYLPIFLLPFFISLAHKGNIIKNVGNLIKIFVAGVVVSTIVCLGISTKNSIVYIEPATEYDTTESNNLLRNTSNLHLPGFRDGYITECDYDTSINMTRVGKNDWYYAVSEISKKQINPGESVTFSCKVKVAERPSKGCFYQRIVVNLNDISGIIPEIYTDSCEIGKWIYKTSTFTNKSDSVFKINTVNVWFTNSCGNITDSTGIMYIAEPKLETGDKATPWTKDKEINLDMEYLRKILPDKIGKYVFIPFKDPKDFGKDYFQSNTSGEGNYSYTNLTHYIIPSYCGLYILFCILFILYGLLTKKTKNKFLSILLILYLTVYLFLIQSRANIISFAITGLLFGIVIYLIKRELLIAVGFTLLLISIVYVFAAKGDRYKSLTDITLSVAENDDISKANVRGYIWKENLKVVQKNNLCGSGVGDVDKDVEKQYNNDNSIIKHFGAHNQYIRTLLESGIFGLMCLLLMLGYSFLKSIKEKKYLITLFITHIGINLIFENMLYRSAGIFFITPFLMLSILHENQLKNSAKILTETSI